MLTSLLLLTCPFLLLIHLYELYSFLPKSIPGPLLAKFTDFYRFLSVYRRSPEIEQTALHRKHRESSDLIRLGPQTVSVCGPGYVQQIYGIDKKLPKSDFYATFQNIVNGRRAASLVAVTNEAAHAKMKRLVANAYALSTLVEFEPLVDTTTNVFLDILNDRFGKGSKASNQVVDLGRYLQFYAFDVMGELTFSKRLGFLESGEDVNSIMASINDNFEYFSLVGQMPWLDGLLGKNPIYIKYLRKNVSSPILQFAQALLRERLQQLESGEKLEKETAIGKPDFLARFLQAKNQVQNSNQAPDEETTPMTDGLLLSFLFGNINAGSDTIATTLRAVFYYLLTNPESFDKLITELETARKAGNLTLPSPTWHETQSDHLVYLRCVVKESLRLWPALSLPLERVIVDKAGLQLHPPSENNNTPNPTILPQGTIVGINPYVLHRDPRIFDPNFATRASASNVEEFDPDRWLPSMTPPSTSTKCGNNKWKNSRDNTESQLKTMEHSLLTFGAGKRSCLGKNIAMMELLKVVPALVLKFPNMKLVDKKKFKATNAWVLAQTGLMVELMP